MQIVNLKLVSHPLNWIIILLMLTIAGIAGHEALSLVKLEPTTSSS